MESLNMKEFVAAMVLAGMYANPNHQYNTHYRDVHEAFAVAQAFLSVLQGDKND